MKATDLQHGRIYFLDYYDGYLFRFDKITGNSISVITGGGPKMQTPSFNVGGWADVSYLGKNSREATPKEIALVEAAELKAGRIFIPKNITYEIY